MKKRALSKEAKEWLSGRLHGKNFPVAIQAAGEIAGAFVEKVRRIIHDSDKREEATHRQACVVHKMRVEDRTESTYKAVAEAKELVKLAVLQWKGDWKRACAMSHMSERTAQNLLVLLAFYQKYHDPKSNPLIPDPEDDGLFGVFAKLGRTKLYQIARLPDKKLRELDPEMTVTVGVKTVPLKFLSDRELLAYLRTELPVNERKRISGLRQLVTKCVLIVDNPSKISKIGAPDLREVRDQAQEIFRRVDRALKTGS
jgi:hypothetical protein